VIFQIQSCVFAWNNLDHGPPIYVSLLAGMAGRYHHIFGLSGWP
jgi:hypothetical protein